MSKNPAESRHRAALLRAELKGRGLSGFVVPRQDEFQGESVAPYAERLRWLTGFSGSWGLAILTLDTGAIFVDGRYTVQVRAQTDVKLFKPHHLVDEPPSAWIAKTLKKGARLGYDPWLTSIEQAERFAKACAKAGAKLVPVTQNPIDAIWTDQPQRPSASLAVHPRQFAGRGVAEKLSDLAKELAKAQADAAVLTLPDSVAWTFNIRGSDVPNTPVALAYAIVKGRGKAELFVDRRRLPEDVAAHLRKAAVVKAPAAIEESLKALGRAKARVLIDGGVTPERVRSVLAKSGAKLVAGSDPCILPKARKNETERQGARAAHVRDGVAMARFLRWLEAAAPDGLTEVSAAERLGDFRAANDLLKDLSFETISASGPNAALPHYRASDGTGRLLAEGEMFLVDSGGQYEDGTTDITRTVIIGRPTEEMCDRFTRVLKGMIGLSRVRFPKGTCGSQLDVLAREHLWRGGLDYDHGTGHGVGAYLSVHEGPARINKTDRTPLEPGMILSNEPGFYKPGHYGIRIENLLMVREAGTIAGGERPMLGFETLTLCPIDRRLIDTSLMTRQELKWFDAYHARVLTEIGPFLEGAELHWLKTACGGI